jgi:hypothetical protein
MDGLRMIRIKPQRVSYAKGLGDGFKPEFYSDLGSSGGEGRTRNTAIAFDVTDLASISNSLK